MHFTSSPLTPNKRAVAVRAELCYWVCMIHTRKTKSQITEAIMKWLSFIIWASKALALDCRPYTKPLKSNDLYANQSVDIITHIPGTTTRYCGFHLKFVQDILEYFSQRYRHGMLLTVASKVGWDYYSRIHCPEKEIERERKKEEEKSDDSVRTAHSHRKWNNLRLIKHETFVLFTIRMQFNFLASLKCSVTMMTLHSVV